MVKRPRPRICFSNDLDHWKKADTYGVMIALAPRNCRFLLLPLLAMTAAFFASGCRTARPGEVAPRKGDEIVVAGQFVHTGTPVVLWMDPAGYDAYRVERRFAPM